MYSKIPYKGEGNLCIRYWMKKKGLTSYTICKALNISKPTFYIYIKNPFLMPLQAHSILAGMFGITVEEFVYCVIRNKPKVKTKEDKWYLADVREKGDKIFKVE